MLRAMTSTNDPAASPAVLPHPGRLAWLDALRGSALFGILLLHAIEHWDFSSNPKNPAPWLKTLNTWTHDTGFFLFGGKAYAIFALLFGVSFFLILERWSKEGTRFTARFLWRLGVLGIFGYLYGLIYCGDVLLIIALLGVPLVFLHRLSTRALAWVSILLVLQIPTLIDAARLLLEPGFKIPPPNHWAIYRLLFPVYRDGSFLDVTAINVWQGQLARLWWTLESGRYTQMLGLFVWGLLLGRAGVLGDRARCLRLAKRALLWGLLGFAIFYTIKLNLRGWGLKATRPYVFDSLVSAYCNLAQMAVWAGGFLLLYQWTKAAAVLRLFAPTGRMSLTCYVTQGLIGVPLFYGYGFGLHRHLGPFYSVLVGVAIFVVQTVAADAWLKRFRHGPLEWLWRACTPRIASVSGPTGEGRG